MVSSPLLDNRHRLIEYIELFRGTIDGANVHPREVVKEALMRNAAAVIFAHFVPRHKMKIMCRYFLCSGLREGRRPLGPCLELGAHNGAVDEQPERLPRRGRMVVSSC